MDGPSGGRAITFPRAPAGSYLYFERHVLDAMQAAGHRAATAWLAAGPLVDQLDEPGASLAVC